MGSKVLKTGKDYLDSILAPDIVDRIDKTTMAGLTQFGESAPGANDAYNNLLGEVMKTGALDVKTHELIALGVSAVTGSPCCREFHTLHALKLGATKEEISEAVAIALTFYPARIFSEYGPAIMQKAAGKR